MSECGNCASLQTQLADWQSRFFRQHSSVSGVVAAMEQERDEPTMPRRKHWEAVLWRLTLIRDEAMGA